MEGHLPAWIVDRVWRQTGHETVENTRIAAERPDARAP
jgi:hypothetical protein